MSISMVLFADKYDDWFKENKVLITQQEAADFKRLKTDAEKEAFIEEFWANRDPSPGTPENEFKDNHQNNVNQVNERVQSRSRKGMETDMGQLLLLLGPPTDQTTEGEDSQNPRQTWTYKNPPEDVSETEIIVEFVPDSGRGEWKFKDKKKMEEILEKAREHPLLTAQKAAETGQPAAQPSMVTQAPAGDIIAPVTSPEVMAALDAASSDALPKDVEIKSLVDSFMTSEGDVFATFAANAKVGQEARVGLRMIDSSGSVLEETETAFVDPAEPAGYFQGKLPAIPGEYTAVLAVVDGDKSGVTKQKLMIPDYEGKFGMSSIILSKKFQQLPEPAPEKVPYTFGKIKVDPGTSRTFSKTDELIIVYEAYNFKTTPEGNPNLEAFITFQRENGKPQKTAPSPPNGLITGKKMTIPTSFALTKFPEGDYKLTVTLTDKVSGEKVSQEASFKVQ